MALDCTTSGLAQNSKLLAGSLSHKQLLASMVYILCTSNNMNCSATSLAAASKCIMCLTEKQLLAALVYVQCQGGGGGSVACGVGAPVAAPSGTCGFYIQTDSVPNAGVIWEYFGGAWHQG